METEKIIVSSDILKKEVDKFNKEEVIHVPELNVLFNIPEDECYMRIRGASLEDHLRAIEISKTPYRVLREVLMKAKKGFSLSEIINMGEKVLNPELSEQTAFEICMFERCVIEPKLNYQEILKLSTVAPTVVNKVANKAINITKGTDLKSGEK